ncbi:MmgE/PrpD family protein [Mesorhizobium amorphae]|uniref:MmgE/PrpD family protein n=1 Tax=Mesorhizobium amorphae TaxID=71433 RepID=UPI003ECDA1E6
MTGKRFHEFVSETVYDSLPTAVKRMAERCLIDLIGTAAAGSQTTLSRIINDHAVRHFAASGLPAARLLFDGRSTGPLGAALGGGFTIDSFDSHDGHVLTKGHAGCAILPGLLGLVEAIGRTTTGEEFLTSLVIGYEVAIRAGIAQHRIAPDYHTSGAWNALGVAAVAGRHLGLDVARMREAVGIAEYHGPRSQMMRCIDFPTMVKDGSGWGAMAGLSAAYLAEDGFTGAPALVVEDEAVADLWSDLGTHWRILELYFKPHPVCRWAQPAIEAALAVRRAHSFSLEDIETIEIETFHNAIRLDQFRPKSTEEAQYSLPFPVAVAVVNGDLPPFAIIGDALQDPTVLSVSDRIRLVEAKDIDARFPAERLARARFRMTDGRILQSETVTALGDAERPLSDAEIERKFYTIAGDFCGLARAEAIFQAVKGLRQQPSVDQLLDLIVAPPQASPQRAVA